MRVTRRHFLQFLASLFAFIPAARALARLHDAQRPTRKAASEPSPATPSPPPPPPPDVPLRIEEAASGKVIEILAEGLRLATNEGSLLLRTSPSTTIWEGLWVGQIPIQVGDHIFAWGQPRPDGSFAAEEIWVNLVNMTGPVSSLKQRDDAVEFFLEDVRRDGRQT